MRGMYSDFTHKVADARLLTAEFVDSVGQGRVWTGPKAVELGLADEIGGLEKAVDYARAEAKLTKGKFAIEEYPRRSWFNFEDFGQPPTAVGVAAKLLFGEHATSEKPTADYELAVLRRISANPGLPLPMLSPEDMPLEGASIGK